MIHIKEIPNGRLLLLFVVVVVVVVKEGKKKQAKYSRKLFSL